MHLRHALTAAFTVCALAQSAQQVLSSGFAAEPLVQLHRQLIETESITGNEGAVGAFLAAYLSAHNYTVEMQLVAGGDGALPRRNVFAYPAGSPRRTRLLLTSHMDTVPPFQPWAFRPGPDSDSYELWGRGAVDAKGCVAAQITAVQQLRAAGEIAAGDVALLFVVGEERDGAGMKAFNDIAAGPWEAVVFGEPTGNKLTAGHRGALVTELRAHGKAAHSAYPEFGVSATSALVRALGAVEQLKLPASEMFGESSTNIGILQGGVALNVIAENATALLLSRLAGGTAEDAMDLIQGTVASVEGKFDVNFGHRFGPVVCDVDIPGFDTEIKRGGTDIPNLKGDHKKYMYGPGPVDSAHSDHEHITLGDLRQGVEGYKKILRTLLQR